jgi:hypothetical protein
LRWVTCGSAQPTVVLEAGRNDPLRTWAAVLAALGGTNQMVAYDRAGLGGSDIAPGPVGWSGRSVTPRQ